jgi:hypothetical protein
MQEVPEYFVLNHAYNQYLPRGWKIDSSGRWSAVLQIEGETVCFTYCAMATGKERLCWEIKDVQVRELVILEVIKAGKAYWEQKSKLEKAQEAAKEAKIKNAVLGWTEGTETKISTSTMNTTTPILKSRPWWRW